MCQLSSSGRRLACCFWVILTWLWLQPSPHPQNLRSEAQISAAYRRVFLPLSSSQASLGYFGPRASCRGSLSLVLVPKVKGERETRSSSLVSSPQDWYATGYPVIHLTLDVHFRALKMATKAQTSPEPAKTRPKNSVFVRGPQADGHTQRESFDRDLMKSWIYKY